VGSGDVVSEGYCELHVHCKFASLASDGIGIGVVQSEYWGFLSTSFYRPAKLWVTGVQGGIIGRRYGIQYMPTIK
jgi:hypothetical protein